MSPSHLLSFSLASLVLSSCTQKTPEASSKAPAPVSEPDPAAEAPPEKVDPATALARKVMIVDGHIDVPFRLYKGQSDGALSEDIAQATEKGDFDYPRARSGGLDAPFMSIYVPADKQANQGGKPGEAKALADLLIDMVDRIAAENPDKFALAGSTEALRKNFEAGKITLLKGMENGAPIEGELAHLKHFYDRGIRYITLTHSKANHICDSSYDEDKKWKGLSPFGRKVVAEMNRLGILVDVSHVSDDTFFQVMEVTKAPVIASHSSARHFTPGWERNMSDEMIEALAKNGGVVMINFGSSFIREETRTGLDKVREKVRAWAKTHDKDPWSEEGRALAKKLAAEMNVRMATVEEVADHIDHVVKIAGVDAVGLGSDFDGVGPTLPTGLEHAGAYPNLIRVLLERGYDEADIAKICGRNLLRVWKAVEAHAAAAS